MKIAIAQINPVIADIDGNRSKIISFIRNAKSAGADLVVFPEMATIGYPPMDLLENKKLIEDNLVSIDEIARHAEGIAVVCGFVDYDHENPPMLFNSAAFMHGGRIVSRHAKTLLPAYDVFDELRYFSRGRNLEPVSFGNRTLGITICEDIWNELEFNGSKYIEYRKYDIDPVKILTEKGCDTIVNISASPFVKGKNAIKRDMLSSVAKKNAVGILYVNQVGGNDSLIFDGNSLALNPAGKFIGRAKGFEEDLHIVDEAVDAGIAIVEDDIEDIRQALALGIRDYVLKCGFRQALVGLSGGIDSALTAVLAAQALGPENVLGVTMPSMYSSKGSVDDSVKLAKNLGIRIETIPIAALFEQYKRDLAGVFRGMQEDITEENIQARIRGTVLMAISNKTGRLLLTTGNKSELATGYCTLYGDMSGGLAVISDLPKMLVYTLAENINAGGEIIPREIIEKAPSAELKFDQKDEDSLPPYSVLDQILEMYIEKKMSHEEIVKTGMNASVVDDVLHRVNVNEYKRLQAAPGLKITAKAFGVGRRIPIAQKFRP